MSDVDAAAPVGIAAVDLGATSGRVMLGVVRPRGTHQTGWIELLQARRFDNELIRREGHLCWDLDALWREIRAGLAAAQMLAHEHGLAGISSIGVDSWAVDYGLVGPDRTGADGRARPGTGERIGEVIGYRDDRTDGVAADVARRIPVERQFEITGIAQQPFNTLYQLVADDRLAGLPAEASILLLPDLVAYLLTGERRTEVTNASTTGMFDATAHDWSPELLATAGVDADRLPPLVEPGERIGTVRPELAAEIGAGTVPVVAVGSHDTASAVAAVPAQRDPAGGPVAYISSGTWSLIGLEVPSPVTTERARKAGFTSEGGVGGSFRLLKNVSGMWLVSESIRQWRDEGARLGGRPVELATLLEAAAAEPAGRFRVDPTDPGFLAPGRMADRVIAASWATGGGNTAAQTPAQVVRCILESLAATYRDELLVARELAGAPRPTRLHVVGGGSQNALLNQLTADALGIEVVAGPVEATALGNIAVQAQHLAAIAPTTAAIRDAVRSSVGLEVFVPGP